MTRAITIQVRRKLRTSCSGLLAASLMTVPMGCAPTGPEDDWLIGAWVIEGESCLSGAPYIFNDSGRWYSEGAEGQWSLVGDKLTLQTSFGFGEDGPETGGFDRLELTIASFSDNGFRTLDDGAEVAWERCSRSTDPYGGRDAAIESEESAPPIVEEPEEYRQVARRLVQSARGASNLPPEVLNVWRLFEEQCRGASPTTPVEIQIMEGACLSRDIIVDELAAAGWCYGDDDDAGYERDWKRCE